MERKQLYQNILDVSSSIGLPVKKILDTLYYLRSGDQIHNNTLLRMVGVSRNVLNQTKRHLQDAFGSALEFTSLSSTGLKITQCMDFRDYLPEEKLFSMLDSYLTPELRQALETSNRYKVVPLREFDQFSATIETVGRRAALMDFFGDIDQKNILFLGDDDFTSVAISKYGKAKKITVMDIDERVLSGINQAADQSQAPVISHKYDVRDKLPANFVGKFDVVFTDPPYTSEGISLFLSRAIQSLNPKNESARIYFCYGNSDRAKERFLPIYEVITNSGMIIRWIFDKFNRYEGAESIGSSSSLFICDVTPQTRALIRNEFKGNIYTLLPLY